MNYRMRIYGLFGTKLLIGAVVLLLLAACSGATSTVPATSTTAVPQLSNVLERMQSVSPAVEQVQSAIVSIVVEFSNQDSSALPLGINRRGTRYGSGVIFDRQGFILTNSQVIQNASQVTVTLLGGSRLEAEVVGADLLSGLAVLRIPGNDYPFLPLASDAEVRVGDLVIAVGNSSRAPIGSTVVSAGVVSVLGRSIEVPPGLRLYDLMQTDINATPNHNGAPLINPAGELVGIIVEAVDGQVGISFAIGMDTAVPVARQLVELGRARYPYLGVFFASSTQEVAVFSSGGELTSIIRLAPPEDPIVEGVDDNGPAKLGGIKPGDLLVSLGGYEVASTDDVLRLLRREFKVGQEIKVVVTRDGETQTFRLVLAERPTSTSLPVKPSLSECKPAPDGEVETGHRATQAPPLNDVAESPQDTGQITEPVASDADEKTGQSESGEATAGYGGHFFDSEETGVLYVYMLDPSQWKEAREEIRNLIPTLVMSSVEIRTLQGDYTLRQLERWRKEAEAALWPSRQQLERWRQEGEAVVWPVAGVWSSGIGKNRIRFSVYTSYVAEQAREALAETNVPIDAVIFEIDPKQRLDDPPVQIDSPIGISISLEFQRNVPLGQPVLIEVVLTNVGDDAAEVEHGFPINEDVLVFTSDGDEVWTKRRGAHAGVGGSTRLEPGGQIRAQTLWEQRDLDGFELPPGCYLVRGSMHIADASGGIPGRMDLATEPYELVIWP